MADHDTGHDPAGRALALAFAERHPHRAAAVLGRFEPAMAAAFLEGLDPAMAGDLLQALPPEQAAACLTAMADAAASAHLGAMPRRSAAAILRRLAPVRRGAIQQALPRATRLQLDLVLHQPGHRIGAWMDPQVPAVPAGSTAETARQHLAATQAPAAEAYLVDAGQRLLGVVPLPRLAGAPPEQAVDALSRPAAASLRANMSVEAALALPAWEIADCLPVLDGEGRLVGQLRHAALRRAARQEDEARESQRSGEYVSLANSVYVGLAEILATSIGRTDRAARRPSGGSGGGDAGDGRGGGGGR